MALRVFGLTGGIGSGKSSVAARFRARSLPVVDADELARAVVVPGSASLSRIVEYFGPTVLLSHTSALDRARLASIVFSDPEARRALDAIVHPAVRRLATEKFAELAQSGAALACYEVPLLYEVGLERTYIPVVVVNAPDALRRARLALRDHLDPVQINARISAQMPLYEKVRRAHYVIENDTSLADLSTRSDATLRSLCDALGVDPERYPAPQIS